MEYFLKLTLVQSNYHSLKSKRATYRKVYIFLKHINNLISRVRKWLHMSHYVVAMVTKKTQILFSTLIFQWLKCSYSLSVAGVLFKVVLNEEEDHKEHFDTKIDQIACFSGKWAPKTWKISAQSCQKIIKIGRHFGIFGSHFAILLEFWGIFLLKNATPGHNLILKCKIPINSIKQGMFILPAKFKPYFYTCACKWMEFSQILPYISLSLIKMTRNLT